MNQEQINQQEDIELMKDLIATVRLFQAQNMANHAAILSLIKIHPNLDELTEIYMTMMDRLCSVQDPDRRSFVLEHCQKILNEMLSEIAGRKKRSE